MTIINYDGISGINSITSVGSGVKFYNSTGASSFTITPSGTGGASLGDVVVSSINSGPVSGARNRIINGDMRIDQRNAVTTLSSNIPAFTVDRWQASHNSTGAIQVAKSGDYPSTFSSSLLYDVTTADTSIAAGEYAQIVQPVEGFNVSDLSWGSASAQYVTLSFWVKSTTIGTYCASLRNKVTDRSYVAEYSVSSANTWEKKIITIPGDTSGTWDTDNTTGIFVSFTFATGTTYQTTANAWAAGNFIGTSNQVNLLASATNEIRITGVQLEPGTVATPFERRSYGAELALCQRYYYQIGNSYDFYARSPTVSATTYIPLIHEFPVIMRVAPTYSGAGATFAIANLSAISNHTTYRRHLSILGLSNTPNLDAYFILSAGYVSWTAEL
jgi:hypothetical protein